jgi:hypothetical protein
MARRRLPKDLALTKPAYETVLFDGVPMWRAQAWAILDYRLHGGTVRVNSAMRTDSAIKKYRGKGLRPGYKSQRELYDGWIAGVPGFFPANPPGTSSHEGRSDGHPFYGVPKREKIADYKYGLDLVDAPGGSAEKIVRWWNSKGYSAVRPYATNSERHHAAFKRSPASRARARLARWIAAGK